MSEQFYDLIIEDEKKTFNIKDETIKVAIKDVTKSYSSSSLQDGSTFLEYNLPQNRCAYLFKYAALHTDLVSKYFELMMDHDAVKLILEQKKDLKICCLGGGPGNDIVGIVKALAKLPTCHQKVSEVTVLDLCGGWRNSFKHVISRLKQGKVENVSEEFFDSSNFKANLIAVNLLEKIPENVVKVLSNADIICMVKFVSAILGKSEFRNALKVISNQFRLGAMILFIDNFHGKVFEPLNDVSRETGLTIFLGPLHESYKHNHLHSNTKKRIYGCLPLATTQVSVIGCIKTLIAAENPSQVPNISSKSSTDKTDNRHIESDPLRSSVDVKNNCEAIKKSCDKFTQTESKYLKKASKCGKDNSASQELSELPLLLSAFSNLIHMNLKQNDAAVHQNRQRIKNCS